MDTPLIVPVVLSGGSGTRLWPASRPDTPKQLLALVDHRTMLHATLDRVADLPGRRATIVVCGEMQEPIVRSELHTAAAADGVVIVEPVARNTAPAAAAAAIAAATIDRDPVLLVMPADHIITDLEAFHSAVALGARAAADGHLVTFGIVPDHAATGYGYVEVGGSDGLPDGVRHLSRFIEKPNRPTAEAFIASGSFLWNSGMFMFRTSVYLAELERCEGAIADAARRAMNEAVIESTDDDRGNTIHLEPAAFAESPSNSIDYAVMEHTANGVVIALDAGWSDVGSWASLYDLADKDEHGNAVIGDVLHTGVAGSYLRSEGPLLTVVGLSKVVAVSTPDAVLVTHIDKTQDVRRIVAQLVEAGRSESSRAKRTTKSWGSSERLSVTAERTIDQLTLRSGGSLTAKADTVVVVEGTLSCDGSSGSAGTAWSGLAREVELRNESEQPAVAVVIHEG